MIRILNNIKLKWDNQSLVSNNIQNEDVISAGWNLMPMDTNPNTEADLISSNLGTKLSNALENVRSLLCLLQGRDMKDQESMRSENTKPVVFLGMDAPELPLCEISHALCLGNSTGKNLGKAYLNPAADGGYGMLCVPPHAPSKIFSNVRWSQSLTAVSQLKAITDQGIDVIIGSLMSDIDEERDVWALAERLCQRHYFDVDTKEHIPEDDALSVVPPFIYKKEKNIHKNCEHTFNALIRLGMIKKKGDVFQPNLKK